MPQHPVPLNELSSAVQKAVQQVLGKHGAVSIDKLWVGFVAPDTIAAEEAAKVATQFGKEAGLHGQTSVLPLAATAGTQAHTIQKPGHIIGLVIERPQQK